MLRLKQQKAAAAAEKAQEEAEAKLRQEQQASEGGENGEGGQGPISVIDGIGGEVVVTNKVGKKKKTPGELRFSNDLGELDCGTVAKTVFPSPSDLSNFNVFVSPDSGFWKGATYKFTFCIPSDYPHKPPKVHCDTQIYHPNINLQGNVCLNILREDWKPVFDINVVIYGLIYLFYEPNPDDPLNIEAADLFHNNISKFEQTVARTLKGGNFYGKTFERLV